MSTPIRMVVATALLAVVGAGLLRPAGAIEEDGIPRPPVAPGIVAVVDPTDDSLDIRFTDVADNESGYTVHRRSGNAWVQVAAAPASGGTGAVITRTESGLQPAREYCYRIRAFNALGENHSAPHCGYTHEQEAEPLWRAQLRLKTSSIGDAGTDDDVQVKLNGTDNSTWLDYGRDDFEGGDDFVYDLALGSITRRDEITSLRIDKGGSDGWCIEAFTLLVNGVEVFDRSYGAQTCRWLDGAGLDVSFAELRAHPKWPAYEAPDPQVELGDGIVTGKVVLSNGELQSRIESMVGNLIHGTGAYWGDISGPAVEVERMFPETLGVDLDLKAKAEFFGVDWLMDDATLDVDFRLHFGAAQAEVGEPVELDVEVLHVEADADTNWLNEFVFDVLPCGPIATNITGETVVGCASKFEDVAERAVESAVFGFHEHFDIPSNEACCETVAVVITEAGDVEITVTFPFPSSPANRGPLTPSAGRSAPGEMEVQSVEGMSPARTTSPEDSGPAASR